MAKVRQTVVVLEENRFQDDIDNVIDMLVNLRESLEGYEELRLSRLSSGQWEVIGEYEQFTKFDVPAGDRGDGGY